MMGWWDFYTGIGPFYVSSHCRIEAENKLIRPSLRLLGYPFILSAAFTETGRKCHVIESVATAAVSLADHATGLPRWFILNPAISLTDAKLCLIVKSTRAH
jgi:hypothetical protein